MSVLGTMLHFLVVKLIVVATIGLFDAGAIDSLSIVTSQRHRLLFRNFLHYRWISNSIVSYPFCSKCNFKNYVSSTVLSVQIIAQYIVLLFT